MQGDGDDSMTIGKENRKRWVQVKFRLTPEEAAILDRDVECSGLSKNDYLIQTLINRIGLSAIHCERKYCGNGAEISFKLGSQRIGYASCLSFKNTGKVQICSFFVAKPFQNLGIEENLLEEVQQFLRLNEASSLIAYPSAEPSCPTEWKTIEEQTAWYEQQGFCVDHMIYNATPCMIKYFDRG